MREDSEGFRYPVVDKALCVECGLCLRVCPLLHVETPRLPVEVLAAKNRNEEERRQSSSGGVFVALARQTLRRGGVVCGARFDAHWEVCHAWADSEVELPPLMRSKYVQSDMRRAYAEAESYLKQGREVLFTGTPCQIAGLRRFLRCDYSGLTAVDFLCHGVPSPKAWRAYVAQLATLAGGEKNLVSPHPIPVGDVLVHSISFRDKRLGWGKYSFALTLSKATAAGEQNTVSLSRMHRDDPYMQAFLADATLRPCCYRCRFKEGHSRSDLTLADFWGIGAVMPDFDDDRGVSLLLVNTSQGAVSLAGLDLETRPSCIEDARRLNPGGFMEQLRVPPRRKLFFAQLDGSPDVSALLSLCARLPWHARMTRFARRVLRYLRRQLRRKCP